MTTAVPQGTAPAGSNQWFDFATGLLKTATNAVVQDRQNKYEIEKIKASNLVGIDEMFNANGNGGAVIGTGTLLLIGGAVLLVVLMKD